jgi:hypothetical protein
VARRGGAWPRQLLQPLTAVVLLLVVFKLTGWLDRRLSTLPPLIELVILLAAGAGGLALYLAARRRRTRERARSVAAALEPLAPTPSPHPPPVAVPAVAAALPRGTGEARAADQVESHRPSEVPATDPYAELTSSVARAASALEDAAGVLETVTRTCASVLERIEDNRRDTFVAADAVAQFLSCPDARAETASSRPPATAMEPR